MNSTPEAIAQADLMLRDHKIPEDIGYAGCGGWLDEGDGELVRKVYLEMPEGEGSDERVDEERTSTLAHFVVPYSTETGELTGPGELRLTASGAIIGTPAEGPVAEESSAMRR